MRLFSQNEKLIIQQLVNSTSTPNLYLPINLFDDIFNGKNIGFNGDTMDLVFPYNPNGTISADDLFPIYNEILERSLLIDYLEKQGLIFLVPPSTATNVLKTIGNIERQDKILMKINDSIGAILLKSLSHTIYVSETLRAYVNCGFKSMEEQALDEAKSQTKYSIYTLVVAIIALIVAICKS